MFTPRTSLESADATGFASALPLAISIVTVCRVVSHAVLPIVDVTLDCRVGISMMRNTCSMSATLLGGRRCSQGPCPETRQGSARLWWRGCDQRGFRAVLRDAECVEVPMADGCEGFTEALAVALGAELVTTTVRDALGRRIETGVGQLITAALERSARRLIVGLGRSGTNDGGAGMLPALGVRFLKADRRDLDGTLAQPRDLASLDLSDLDPRLAQTTTEVASDVTNPLLGPRGASATFGPQKGASPGRIRWSRGWSTGLGARSVPSCRAGSRLRRPCRSCRRRCRRRLRCRLPEGNGRVMRRTRCPR